MEMDPRINIITLGVKDLEHSTAFYERGLGFPKMKFEGDISFFEMNGTWLSLYTSSMLAKDVTVDHKGSGFRGVSLAHNVKSKTEVLALLKKAEDAGAKIVKPGQKTDWGGFSGYFSDPDGHLWEIAFNPFFWPGPK